ncbi:Uncharacterised protein [Klebsiella pneumoniae]|uniref:Uncharacterized protein n=2 Tax=Klebsiella pneumoniae TaxID=573 RepID=A0A2X3ET79_KLEPN|nr:Uncharacterised protein [Klebsiella pneumoniae]
MRIAFAFGDAKVSDWDEAQELVVEPLVQGTEMSKRYAVVPHPKLKREYKGRLVRTTRVLKNGWGVIPLGAVATVTHQSPKGSELTFEPCDCCGLKAIISHVSMDSIEFIEPITEEEDGTRTSSTLKRSMGTTSW